VGKRDPEGKEARSKMIKKLKKAVLPLALSVGILVGGTPKGFFGDIGRKFSQAIDKIEAMVTSEDVTVEKPEFEEFRALLEDWENKNPKVDKVHLDDIKRTIVQRTDKSKADKPKFDTPRTTTYLTVTSKSGKEIKCDGYAERMTPPANAEEEAEYSAENPETSREKWFRFTEQHSSVLSAQTSCDYELKQPGN